MPDLFLINLLLKMVTSAAIVVAASLIVERAGPFLGAMIATLPISAGPAYAFLAHEHGAVFVEQSSLVSLAVNAATAGFIVTYASLAQRRGALISLAGALALWLAAAGTIIRLEWSLQSAIALNGVAYGGAILVTRRLLQTMDTAPGRPKPWWAVPVRAAGVMAVVAVVIIAGRLIGPKAAGMAALVPVVLMSLAAVLHPRLGGPSAAAVLVNGLPGMIGFALALVLLHVSIVPVGTVSALLAALLVCLSWNAGMMIRRGLLVRA